MLSTVKDLKFLHSLLTHDIYIVSERKRYPLLVLVQDSRQAYLTDEDEELLEKILNAIHLRIEEVRIINTFFPEPEDFFENLDEIPAPKVVAFGINWVNINLEIVLEKYNPKTIEGIVFLESDSLSELQENVEKKKLLWAALKKIFPS